MDAASPPTLAVVVGAVAHGEADRVVHLLTDHGRIAAFAARARTSRRRFGGALQPFTTVEARFGRTRGSLPRLEEATPVRTRLVLAADLERLTLASYLSELSGRLAPEGAPTELRGRLEAVLDHLERGAPTFRLRRAFELGLLEELGFRPRLDGVCGACGMPARHLDLERGSLFCDKHRGRGKEVGPRTVAWLEARLDGGPADDCTPLAPEDATRAARAVGGPVDRALEGLLGRPLASRKMVDELGL